MQCLEREKVQAAFNISSKEARNATHSEQLQGIFVANIVTLYNVSISIITEDTEVKEM